MKLFINLVRRVDALFTMLVMKFVGEDNFYE